MRLVAKMSIFYLEALQGINLVHAKFERHYLVHAELNLAHEYESKTKRIQTCKD